MLFDDDNVRWSSLTILAIRTGATGQADKQRKRRRKPGESDGPLECPTCHRHFGHQSRLVIHERVHSKQRPFRCDVCDKVLAMAVRS